MEKNTIKTAYEQKKSSFKRFLKKTFVNNIDLKIAAFAAAILFWLLIGYFAAL